MSCIVNESENDLFEQMKQYVRYKRYDSIFGDMMPLVVATILKKDIHILTTDDNGMEKTEIKSPGNATCGNHIYVYKIGEHYDAIVPLSQIKPIVTTGFCNEDMLSDSQTDVSCLFIGERVGFWVFSTFVAIVFVMVNLM